MAKIQPQSMASPLWHRVEHLRPTLRPHVRIERQAARGEVWYVALDPLANRSHRFTPVVYLMLTRMDGRHSVGELWQDILASAGEDAPTQDEVIHVLGQLYDLELIQADGSIDTGELAERRTKTLSRRRWQGLRNPLFLRFPLFDPDRLLGRSLHLVAPLFSWFGFGVWLAAVTWLGLQALTHWEPLTRNIFDRVLASDNLLIILVVFPALKLIHELGHGYATKRFGGEVHEMGIMLLIGLPVPYVDASASAAFASRWQRALVGAAGVMAELVAAVVAMAVWITVEPGLVRAAAFNVLIVAGVSTLLVNGNPLLRFDGYYILSDLIAVPNLASRANRYLGYLVKTYAFGFPFVPMPAMARGERFWMLAFAPASFVYRMTVMIGLALVVAKQYFVFGIVLAIWTVVSGIGWPILKGLNFVFLSKAAAVRRGRAIGVTAGGIAAIAASVLLLPIPHGTVVRGQVWLPEEAQVMTETNGRFVKLLVEPGQVVEADTPLIELSDPLLLSQRRRLSAKVDEFEHRLRQAESLTPYDGQFALRQLEFARTELTEADRKVLALTVRSRVRGRFALVRPGEIDGLEVKRGHLFGHVLPEASTIVRAVVPEADYETVATSTRAVAVRLDSATFEPVADVKLLRAVPGATRTLPSPAFAQPAGGPIALDPTSKSGDTALLPFFEIDLQLPSTFVGGHYGERAWVRFDHGASAIGARVYRSLRQLFLRQFNV